MKNIDEKIIGKKDFHYLKRLFNVKQAPSYLGVSASAIYKYMEWRMIAFLH